MNKGLQVVKVCKVNGHATEVHIEKSISTRKDKEGNDKADEVADIGVKVHGEDLIDIAGQFHTRLKWYINFMKTVHKHIIEGYAIHRLLIDQPDKEER